MTKPKPKKLEQTEMVDALFGTRLGETRNKSGSDLLIVDNSDTE